MHALTGGLINESAIVAKKLYEPASAHKLS